MNFNEILISLLIVNRARRVEFAKEVGREELAIARYRYREPQRG